MALAALLLLLSGMLATEFALFGIEEAGLVGVALLLLCAAVLTANAISSKA